MKMQRAGSTGDAGYKAVLAKIKKAARHKATALDLSRLGITALPPEIGECTALIELNLADNQLTSLPAEIGQCTALTSLTLSGNQLTELPAEIGQCTALTGLYLYKNQLTALPAVIGECTALTLLYLNFNQLTELPAEIGKCTALIQLNLADNQLTVLPAEIGKCTALIELNLTDNQLTSLPAEIGQCTALIELYIADNQLTSLPAEIGKCTTLTELYLYRNQLTALPAEIGECTALTLLDISDNQLRAVPPEIGQCTALSKLFLDNNQLSTLPAAIRQCDQLERLFLHGNLALGIDSSVLGPTWEDLFENDELKAARPQDILNYYFELLRAKGHPLNEVKVLLVGAGDVGKSSLVERLVYDRFDKNKQETPGISIADWTLPVDGTDITAHLWDFAGQEITHETHRFFLTERSLYLVVLDHRRNQEGLDAVYWLQHIERYGKGSPVIVVLNKSDERAYEVDEHMLERKFKNIRGFVRTGCASVDGCADLKAKMVAVIGEMPDVRAEWPTTYMAVKNELAKRLGEGQPMVSYADYLRICADSGVSPDQTAGLSRSLHNIGAALWYGDDPRLNDMRVLNPNWVANGLYGILRGGQQNPCGRPPGEVHVADVGALIQAAYAANTASTVLSETYPADQHRFLLELLVDRDLAFVLNAEVDPPVYLIPSLLAAKEPAPSVFDVGGLIQEAEVHLRYSYTVLPSDVMPRFIVRSQAMSTGEPRWKNGVVLRWRGAVAVVLASKGPDQITVHAKGADARARQELCGLIQAYMQEAQLKIGDALVKEELALAEVPDRWEDLNDLRDLAQANRTLPVKVGSAFVDVKAAQEVERVDVVKREWPDGRKPKVFVSYSHDNVPYRKEWDRYLKVLKLSGLLEDWHDTMLRPDDKTDDKIAKELETCDVVILLMSVDLMGSWYVRTKELPLAEKRSEDGACRLLPVVLKNWPVLKAFYTERQWPPLPLGPDQRVQAIADFNDHDSGWDQVYAALEKMLEEVRGKKK